MAAYWEGDKAGPLAKSTPEHGIVELPLCEAGPNILNLSEVGAIPMPVNSCGSPSGCSISIVNVQYDSNLEMSNKP